MIPDSLTNIVYLADNLLKDQPADFRKFKTLLENYNIRVRILRNTLDWYCRDYMPIQIERDRFVQFVFRPEAYFKKSEFNLISNPLQIGLANNLPKPVFSRIILDGGNVVKWTDKVIITDQVYSDNEYQFDSHDEIIKELEKVLECHVIIIPRYPAEKTGHADGLIRFIDDHRVFVNDKKGEPPEWVNEFIQVLKSNLLDSIEIPCTANTSQKSGKGLYINHLQVGNLVVVPKFGQKEDDIALETITEAFGPSYHVVFFDANWISEHGGVFNCGTWTVFE